MKTFYVKTFDTSTNIEYSGIGTSYNGYMNGILEIILNNKLINVELEIDGFKFDVEHLRTQLK